MKAITGVRRSLIPVAKLKITGWIYIYNSEIEKKEKTKKENMLPLINTKTDYLLIHEKKKKHFTSIEVFLGPLIALFS